MARYAHVLSAYMDALGRADYSAIKSLFSAGGRVRSPFLGEMAADPFFDRLAAASEKNVITPIDVFESTSDSQHAVAYFRYDWTVSDGSLISFTVMDYFQFEPGSDRIALLDLIYDTHPIRVEHGNKYDPPL